MQQCGDQGLAAAGLAFDQNINVGFAELVDRPAKLFNSGRLAKQHGACRSRFRLASQPPVLKRQPSLIETARDRAQQRIRGIRLGDEIISALADCRYRRSDIAVAGDQDKRVHVVSISDEAPPFACKPILGKVEPDAEILAAQEAAAAGGDPLTDQIAF